MQVLNISVFNSIHLRKFLVHHVYEQIMKHGFLYNLLILAKVRDKNKLFTYVASL